MRVGTRLTNEHVLRDVIPVVATGLLYLVAAKAGLALAYGAEQVTLVWPATGIALVAVLSHGYRVWPGLWLGAFIANITTHEPGAVAAVIASGNTLEALTAVWLLRRLVDIDQSFERFKPTIGLLVYGGFVSTLVSATVGVLALCAGGVQPWASFVSLWLTWWLGDLMGDLLVAPVLLTWSAWPRRWWPGRRIEAAALMAGVVVVAVLVFSGRLGMVGGGAQSLAYPVFPFVVWAALRFGYAGAALTSLVTSIIAIIGTARGTGPFAGGTLTENLMLLQVFLAVVAATGLLLGAVVTENRAAQRKRVAEHEVTRILAEAGSLEEAIPRVLATIAAHLRWETGSYWCRESDDGPMRRRATWPEERADPDLQDQPAETGSTAAQRAWAEKRAVWIPRTGTSSLGWLLPPLRRNATFAFPVRLDGELFGVLEFRGYDAGHVDHELLLKLGTALGSQIGQFAARKRAEFEVAQSEARKASVMDAALDCIVTLDQAGLITEFNPAAERTFGYSRTEAIGQDLATLLLPLPERDHFRRGLIEGGDSSFIGQRIEMTALRADGTKVPAELSVARIDSAGRSFFTAFLRDISERRRLVEELVFRASHDAHTGLQNRAAFMERLAGAMRQAALPERRMFRCGVLLMDLDHFKEFNDHHGHLLGDQLLVAVAHRLEASMRPGDTVARLGGDEFAVILDEIGSMREAAVVGERVQHALSTPFSLGGYQIHTTVSMGIALSAPEYRRPEDILRDADMALYDAKAHGRGRFQVFDPAMHARTRARKELEKDLRRAVARQEFTISYQPIKSLRTGRVTCMEALVRWQHPQRGLLEPTAFIPLAESTGLIDPIGAWVLQAACAEAATWGELIQPAPAVAINVSARQFQRPGLVKAVRSVLDETGLNPDGLALEITESLAMKDIDLTIESLNDLDSAGVQLAIDDFGTGYSSLSCLRHFPIKTLKIDQSFVRQMPVSVDDTAIVAATIAMAHTLRLDVVAEGVEHEAQLRFLQQHDCDQIQGHLVSAPMQAEVARRLMKEGLLVS